MKFALSFMVVSVGQMCNLRCKDCANFAPYAPKEIRRYPIENVIADFESLFKAVGRIDTLQIQGGEPLVYSDLAKLTSYLRACKEINEIVIATNGTITPSDELMRNFAINDIKIRISDYNLNRRNLEAFVAKAQAYGVKMRLFDFATNEALWYDCGGLNTPREDDDAIVAERFAKCKYSICLTLENGELHRCSRAVNAHRFQGFDILPPPPTMFASAATRTSSGICWNIFPRRTSRPLAAIATGRRTPGKSPRPSKFEYTK